MFSLPELVNSPKTLTSSPVGSTQYMCGLARPEKVNSGPFTLCLSESDSRYIQMENLQEDSPT